jgi:hypothetical protein
MVRKPRIILSCLALLGACMGLGALLISAFARQRIPLLAVDREVVDLGTINVRDSNLPRRIRFEVMNHGSGVLKLIHVDASCACFQPRLEKDTLLPGETTQLSVRLAIPNRLGAFTESMTLVSNDPRRAITRLTIRAVLDADSFVLPESLVVDNLRFGEQRRIDLEVTGPPHDDSFCVHEVSASNGLVARYAVEKAATVPESRRATWRICLTVAPRGAGTWEDTIEVSTTDHVHPVLKVPVKVTELPLVQCDPPIVILRRRAGEGVLTAEVSITSCLSAKIPLVRVEKPPWLAVRPDRGVHELPTKLLLTAHGESSTLEYGMQGLVLLVLGENLPPVRIPVLLLP